MACLPAGRFKSIWAHPPERHMQKKMKQLIALAEERMKSSHDKVHDDGHARRVVQHAKDISHSFILSSNQKQALILAAWWHDTGRTIIKKPSVVWMRAVDDALSAFLLWKASLQLKLISQKVNTALRIIICKNFGTSRIFTKILLRKKDRILLDILNDADGLDVLCLERLEQMRLFAKISKTNRFKYKMVVWWFMHSKEFHFRTNIAKINFEIIFNNFIVWLKEKEIYRWHAENFSQWWIEKNIMKARSILKKIKTI